jgi:acyl-[acyl carrier protein]--UDP-N-acetylglucosamine O-acyltransferase
MVIEKVAAFLGLVLAVAGGIGSWMLIRHKQAEQETVNKSIYERLTMQQTQITELKHQSGIANAKREDMLAVLEENRRDVKNILQEIAKLATLISVNNNSQKTD